MNERLLTPEEAMGHDEFFNDEEQHVWHLRLAQRVAAAVDEEYKLLVKVLQDIVSYPTTSDVVHMFQMAAQEALAQRSGEAK